MTIPENNDPNFSPDHQKEEDSQNKDKKKFSFRSIMKKPDSNQINAISSIEQIDIKEEDLWETVGLHKTLGGNFFRNFTYMLIGAIIGTITFTFVLQQLIPFPISKGYYDISHSLFAFVWMIFDVGTAYGIERFIAEHMIKDKKRMMKYIQFYIWYQMWTGLVQLTAISIWIFTTVPYGNLAHLGWLLLIINSKQWPGMLGTFNSVLKGMQQYDKTIIIAFVGTQGFQFITQIIFFIGGRYWGMANPQIGELLGLSIGMVLGYYIDDFFTMGLAMYYFGKVAEKMGFRARQAWGHDFDWPIIKECLSYGIGLSWAPLIGVGIGLIQLTMSLDIVPGYANWVVLAGVGGGMAQVMNMGGDIDTTSVLSESLNNGKLHLSSYYLEQSLKYWAFIMFAMAGIIVVLLPIVSRVIFIIPSVADQYENALIFIIPGMINMVWDAPIKQLERVIVMAGRVWFKSTLDLILNIFNLILWYLMIYVGRIWEWGTIGIIILFVLAQVPGKIIRLTAYIIYIQTKIFKIRISWYQTFGASIFTLLVVFLIGQVFIYAIFLPMLEVTSSWFGAEAGVLITGAFGVVVLLVGFMVIIFPFTYAIFGGWDSFGLETLRKSYLLTGPSKIFIYTIYRLSVIGSKMSPLYNKFGLDWSKAFQEAEELLLIKRQNEAELQIERSQKGNVELS